MCEGYKIYGTTACNEWGEPEYDVGIGEYDEGDSEYWDNSDNGRRHSVSYKTSLWY